MYTAETAPRLLIRRPDCGLKPHRKSSFLLCPVTLCDASLCVALQRLHELREKGGTARRGVVEETEIPVCDFYGVVAAPTEIGSLNGKYHAVYQLHQEHSRKQILPGLIPAQFVVEDKSASPVTAPPIANQETPATRQIRRKKSAVAKANYQDQSIHIHAQLSNAC